MTEHATDPQEWQRLAWAIGAEDAAMDEPRYPDTDQDDEAEAFRSWAERAHGATARAFIAGHDALMTIRFGPETSPDPLTAGADSDPTTPEQFARQVQALIDAHDDDWEIRDDQIVSLATRYAAQFLPGGLRFPSVAEPTRCAVALAGPNESGRYAVLLLALGQIGGDAMGDDFATLEQAQQAADQWNTANGVTQQRIGEILAGPRGPIAAGPTRFASLP